MDLCNGGFEMSMRKCDPELISETHVGKPLMHRSETHVDSNGLIVTNGIDSELLNCVTLYQPVGTRNGGEEVVEGGAVAIGRQLVRVFPQPNNRIPSPEVVQRESNSPRAVNPIPHFFIDKLQAMSNVMGRSPPWTNRVPNQDNGQILRKESSCNGSSWAHSPSVMIGLSNGPATRKHSQMLGSRNDF